MRFLLLIVCFISFGTIADLNIKNSNIQENYSEIVKASGKFHLGIQFSGKHDFDNLYVHLPKDSQGLLCITMSSIDGVYKAELKHAILEKVSGKTKVNFTSQYASKIASLGENELSILATIGKNCHSSIKTFLVSSWSSDTSSKSPVLIIRSGARIDIAHVPNIANSKKSFHCKKFKSNKVVTFDKYCEFTGLRIEEITSIEVFRRHLRDLPTESILISL